MFLENIYQHSPVMMQNLMTSVYGYKLYRLRYTGQYSNYLEQVRKSQWLTDNELAMLQKQKLISLLDYAKKFVPFYANNIESKDYYKDQSIEEILAGIPILSKEVVKNRPDDFVSSETEKDKLNVIYTSGSTGTPLKIYTTPDTLQLNYAYFTRTLDWAGCALREKSITFAGRTIVPTEQKEPPYWRVNPIMNNTLFSSYHISDKTLNSYIRKIENIMPVFIDSYPSAIYTIANYIERNNVEHRINPKAIITSSETLLDHHREIVERVFNCKIFDQYGNAEMAAFISQCELGNYHVNADYGIVEVIDDTGSPVAVGEPGNLICTGFVNRTMPLIRYRIGDSICMDNNKCDCGRSMPVVKTLLGRTDDIIKTADGRLIGRLDPIFKGLSGIKETQIVQTTINNIELHIVKDFDYKDEILKTLITQLKSRIGNDIEIEVVFLNSIKRTKAGKFKSVVSKV